MNNEITYEEKNFSYTGCDLCGRQGEDERAYIPITRMHERLGHDICVDCSRLYSDRELLYELHAVKEGSGSEIEKEVRSMLVKFEEGTQLYIDRTLVDFSGVEYYVISISDEMITVQITDRGWDTLKQQIGSHEQMIIEECRYLCSIPNMDEDADIYAQVKKHYYGKETEMNTSIEEFFNEVEKLCLKHLGDGSSWTLERDPEALGPRHEMTIHCVGLFDGYSMEREIYLEGKHEWTAGKNVTLAGKIDPDEVDKNVALLRKDYAEMQRDLAERETRLVNTEDTLSKLEQEMNKDVDNLKQSMKAVNLLMKG